MNETQTVALIHGWATPSWVWRNVRDRLHGHGIETHVHDLPGYGNRVSENGQRTLAELVDDALQHTPPHAVWVGWSLGAIVGLAAAMSAKSMIRSFFGVSATAKFCDSPAIESALIALRHSVDSDPAKTIKRFHRSLPSSLHRREIVRQLETLREIDAEPNRETLLAGLDILAETDLSDRLNRIQIPLRLICGTEDPIIASDASLLIQQRIAGCELTALPCGHLPFLECPEIFIESLLEFIQANSKSREPAEPSADSTSV